jgi:hypothetical protein
LLDQLGWRQAIPSGRSPATISALCGERDNTPELAQLVRS